MKDLFIINLCVAIFVLLYTLRKRTQEFERVYNLCATYDIALSEIDLQLKGMDEKTPTLKDGSIEEKIEFLLWINEKGKLTNENKSIH